MHYYSFNIGDYIKSTRHLDPIEDLAYRRMLDLCYDSEKPLPKDAEKVARLIGLKNNLKETQAILSEYFKLTKNGYIQKRVQEELKRYSAKASAARENGKLGGRPKKTQSVNLANPDLTQPKAKQETITNNHIKDKKGKWDLPEWVNVQAWKEFEQHRKEINKPLSDMARTKAANSLKDFNHDEQQTAIDTSIQNRWSGLFPKSKGVNDEENKRTGNNGKQSNLAWLSKRIQDDIKNEV